MLCSPFGNLETPGSDWQPLLVPVNESDQEIQAVDSLEVKVFRRFPGRKSFLGLISKTLGAFLVSKTSALSGTLCEWQHASHLSQASKQKHSNDPTTSHIWVESSYHEGRIIFASQFTNSLSIGESETPQVSTKIPLTIARLHLVWLSLSVLVLPTVPKES